MSLVPSFTWAGGFLSKGLWGRVDLTKYMTGLSVCTNFIIGVEGGVDKRPGLYYVGKPKYQDREAKLVRWRLADDDSYVLEIGDQYVRFIRFGGYVLWPVEIPFTPHPDSDAIEVDGFVEVPLPYLAEHVAQLKFTFANDIIYIFHKNYPPAQLRRLGLYDWDYVVSEFNPHESAPTGLAVVWQRNDTVGGGAPNWQTANMDQPDYAESPQKTRYKVSATMADGLETLPSAHVEVESDLGNQAFRNRITWDAKSGAQRYTIYKSKSGIYGFIGYVDAPDLEFIDNNLAPSYDVVPVIEFNGFGEGLEDDPETEYPRVGEFRKQRLAYAASARKTQTLWFSRPLFFTSLSSSIPVQDDDAIVAPLVGRERHTINHLIELKEFFAFTDSAEWVIKTTGNAALTVATIDPVKLTAYGCDPNLSPIPIGTRILFAQNISGAIFDMGYELTADDYKADDLTRLARDLFQAGPMGKKLAMVYANTPYNLLWTPLVDGSFPSMTYVRQHEIWGWAKHTTQGKVFDCASTPEFDQDAVYFQVLRTINGVPTRTVERLEVLYTKRIEELFYVDCGLTYENGDFYASLLRFSDTEIEFHQVSPIVLEGNEVQLEAGGFHHRFVVTEVGADYVRASSKYNKPVPEDFPTSGIAYICGDEIIGFDHLAGQTGLVALADGNVFTNITVDETGKFTLPIQAARVHAGFPYTAELVTLGLDDERAAGRVIERTIDDIWLRLENSRGLLAGPATATGLQAIASRSDEDMAEPNKALDGVYRVDPLTAWTQDAKVRVLSPDPLPASIRNIIPSISYGS